MSLEVNNITKYFGTFDKKIVLEKINFQAKAGDIIGVLGLNGAGKSTLMKIITGYYTQSKGTILVCGKDTLKNRKFTQSKIGYLSEENPLYSNMYVREFLQFICNIHQIQYSKVVSIMELTSLNKVKNQKINTLSKGFRQRLGIAQALIHDPDVILLDEPTSGLDPKQLIEIRSIITNIGKDKTILLSTHIIQEIEAICNRVIILNNGKIVLNKRKKDLKQNIEKKFLELTK